MVIENQAPFLIFVLTKILIGVAALIFHDVFIGVKNLIFNTIYPTMPVVAAGFFKYALSALITFPQNELAFRQ